MGETFDTQADKVSNRKKQDRIIETRLNRKHDPILKYKDIISILLGVVFIMY